MHPRVNPSPGLLALARRQAGVLASAQLEAGGLGRRSVDRLIGDGRWRRLAHGIVHTSPEPAPLVAYAWAGVLLGGAGARIGGAAAGLLHGVLPQNAPRASADRYDAPVEVVEVIEVLVAGSRHLASRHRWRFVREAPGERSHSVGLPPRLGLEDTVLDLCARSDERGIVDLVTRAVQTRRTSAAMLQRRLEQRTRIRGRGFLEAILADVHDGVESPLELDYLRRVERGHGLPRGRRQVRAGGDVRDVYYEDYDAIVELDGRVGHDGVGRFRDLARDNRATLTGAATLRFGWHDVIGDPCRVAAAVATLLQLRGWQGQLQPCRRCPTPDPPAPSAAGLWWSGRDRCFWVVGFAPNSVRLPPLWLSRWR